MTHCLPSSASVNCKHNFNAYQLVLALIIACSTFIPRSGWHSRISVTLSRFPPDCFLFMVLPSCAEPLDRFLLFLFSRCFGLKSPFHSEAWLMTGMPGWYPVILWTLPPCRLQGRHDETASSAVVNFNRQRRNGVWIVLESFVNVEYLERSCLQYAGLFLPRTILRSEHQC